MTDEQFEFAKFLKGAIHTYASLVDIYDEIIGLYKRLSHEEFIEHITEQRDRYDKSMKEKESEFENL